MVLPDGWTAEVSSQVRFPLLLIDPSVIFITPIGQLFPSISHGIECVTLVST